MTTIEAWDAATFEAHLEVTGKIYVEAMQYTQPTELAGRRYTRAARVQATFAAFTARIARAEDGTPLGFCYGYTSQRGQWWHELMRDAVGGDVAQRWLEDAFKLCELHVRPDAQGRGIGRQLLLALADGLPHARMLLSTREGDTRALRLYHRMGFVDLVRHHAIPGEDHAFAVLGTGLPLAAAAPSAAGIASSTVSPSSSAPSPPSAPSAPSSPSVTPSGHAARSS